METHVPVLMRESVDSLALRPDATVLDATLGTGGHASAIVRAMQGGVFVGIDADEHALTVAKEKLTEVAGTVSVHYCEGNFRDSVRIASDLGIHTFDAILADLGWGIHQQQSGRGFSFTNDEPLNMCYSTRDGACAVTALEVVNTFEESALSDVLLHYGEERWAVRIAKHIVAERKNKKIVTTRHLAEVVSRSVPRALHPRDRHVATKTFQAIRMVVNDELQTLRQFLEAAAALARAGTRISVITFHSSEDRIVKQTFRAWERDGFGKQLTKTPITASRSEISANPRARSAKLRTFTVTTYE